MTVTSLIAETPVLPGTWIFVGFVVLFFLAVAYGYWTRTGSGINQRPHDAGGSQGGASRAPGAGGSSRISSADRDDDVPLG
jgi:hypothetical protein